MKKITKILFSIILVFTIVLCTSCGKKPRFEKNEDSIQSYFDYENSMTIKCNYYKGVSNRHLSGKIVITDLELTDLKNKTNGKVYSETDAQITYLKDGSYFIIRFVKKMEEGSHGPNNIDFSGANYYQLNSDYCMVRNGEEYDPNERFVRIPFPSFLVEYKPRVEGIMDPTYVVNQTKIDSKYKEYLKDYYNNLSSDYYDFIDIKDDLITITLVQDPYRKDIEVTINLKDDITINYKELGD